jgi:hypothetical protein
MLLDGKGAGVLLAVVLASIAYCRIVVRLSLNGFSPLAVA